MAEEIKKTLSPEQIADKNLYHEVHVRSNHQTSRRLKRLARESESNIDATWAIVLSLIFDNTKPVGKMEPYLR
jgi:hypothetical protein